ncbi:transglutaminase TgpA family protein [Gracilibacillus suaedae]|uniref:transglutaminase TgpA family protein n=1 Tax=Gracilibacillus suaedae TaxID=2820273 RepID=UPI001ABE37C1|nr:transglutaminase domain-containing protein [Gracilibacillus suaedae]
MKKNISLETVSSFILLLAGFLLFWEWIRPLEQITDTGSVHLFVIYTAICFVTSFLTRNGWAKFVIKSFSLLFILDYLFLDATLLSHEWIQTLTLELRYNLAVVWENDWALMTSFFRSFLFLLLLWLMSYLLHYWFMVANKFFLFVVLTFIYLAVLDTYTVYDAQLAMIRTFVVSFLVLGLSRYVKLMNNVDTTDRKKHVWSWMTPVLVIVLFATILGIYSPKLNPQWPDPVPFIQSTAGHVGFSDGPVQKVGYGEDDSQLGGSFVEDDSPVFEVIAHDDIYWRIESKDLYTGKGWERSKELDFQELTNGSVGWSTFSQQVETSSYSAEVRPVNQNQLPKVVYPYGINRISSLGQGQDLFFSDREYGHIEFESSEQNQNLSYNIEYDAPSFEINELRNNSNNDPEDIREQYLQLPDSLPERVSELALEVTEGEDNRYDKAQAIESYFSTNGYVYQIEDVSVPEEGEDYVDQFLFETKVGYCDNFSTSMVVMLRALDIPARWVKGFTGGVEAADQPPLPDDYSLYEVTNNNAHSWVEVYFPESGWVPFEPTSGFTNPTDFYVETSGDVNTEDYMIDDEETEEESEQESSEEEQENEPLNPAENENEVGGANNEEEGNDGNYYWIGAVLFILAILATIIYRKRTELRDWYLLKKWGRLKERLEIEASYVYLLEILEKRGMPRTKGQTLRQYAKEVDQRLGTSEMYDITLAYEEYLYRDQTSSSKDNKRLQGLFQQMIDQILA